MIGFNLRICKEAIRILPLDYFVTNFMIDSIETGFNALLNRTQKLEFGPMIFGLQYAMRRHISEIMDTLIHTQLLDVLHISSCV